QPHDGPPHTTNIHVFFHHDFAGGPPGAMRFLIGHGAAGEMHGPSPRRPERPRRESDEDDEDESEDEELESLRDDVASLRKELAELSALVRKLAEQNK
ncbi:MAG: hypothetical protein ACREHD_10465, partial [Pirellulales bacterium]